MDREWLIGTIWTSVLLILIVGSTGRELVRTLLEDKQFLERWKNLPNEDATWEGEHILEHPTLRLLEGKQHLGGEDYHVPSQNNL